MKNLNKLDKQIIKHIYGFRPGNYARQRSQGDVDQQAVWFDTINKIERRSRGKKKK